MMTKVGKWIANKLCAYLHLEKAGASFLEYWSGTILPNVETADISLNNKYRVLFFFNFEPQNYFNQSCYEYLKASLRNDWQHCVLLGYIASEYGTQDILDDVGFSLLEVIGNGWMNLL